MKYRIRSTDRYVVAGGTLVFAALYLWVVALIADGSPVLPTQPAAIIGLCGSASWARSSPTSCTSS